MRIETMPPRTKRRWSSQVVGLTLVALGGGVAGCDSPDDDVRRNQYKTQAECIADYSERECEPQARSGGGFFFLGPMYRGNWRSQPAGAYARGGGPGKAALASPDGVVAQPTQTRRGGFGTTGRSYSSRGG
jgi:hypothetical protein